MPTLILRLTTSRPDFATTMSEEERAVMGRHAEHWGPSIADGSMVVFGPVLGAEGSWGLGVLESEDEDGVRAHAAADPVVTTGTGSLHVETLLTGFVRGR